MTKQSLQARFKINPKNNRSIPILIQAALHKNLIKMRNEDETDPKKIRYIPFWA
jgi:predicted DNA-binding transcriptional regulator YafY